MKWLLTMVLAFASLGSAVEWKFGTVPVLPSAWGTDTDVQIGIHGRRAALGGEVLLIVKQSNLQRLVECQRIVYKGVLAGSYVLELTSSTMIPPTSGSIFDDVAKDIKSGMVDIMSRGLSRYCSPLFGQSLIQTLKTELYVPQKTHFELDGLNLSIGLNMDESSYILADLK